MDSIRLKIVTPEKIVFEENIDQISVPTQNGMITVLPHHAPVMALVMPGELTVQKGTNTTTLAVSSGFIQVHSNEVTILAETAETAEAIDEARAEAARERAQKLMREMKNTEDVNYVALAGKMEKELARLRVAKKRKAPHTLRPNG